MNLFGKQWTKAELLQYVGDIQQVMGVKALEMTDGTERGNRLIDVRNGSGIRFSVSPDRGMDISYAEYRGIPLAWRSSAGDVSPAYFSPLGNDWLRCYPGGLFVTGGLTQFGSPNTDEGVELGLHGRASNLSATRVAVNEYWTDDKYVMEVSGVVRETTVYGENLRLQRMIRTIGGFNEIDIFDTVTNDGHTRTPHMMLYHFNMGFPLISPDSVISISNTVESTVILDGRNQGWSGWERFGKPDLGYADEIFHHAMNDRDEYGYCEIVHSSLLNQDKLTARVSFRIKELPNLYNWKILNRGMYILGVEPANCRGIGGRAEARKTGLPMLEPQESVSYHVKFAISEG